MTDLVVKPFRATALAKRFHTYVDTRLIARPSRVIETRSSKYIIVQERELDYRFYLHQHPYVEKLMGQLLRKGVAGLQAADTEYAPDDTSLPGSVEIAMVGPVGLTVPGGSKIALLNQVQVTLPGGASQDLPAHMELRTTANGAVTVPNGLKATLLAGMPHTPSVGAIFPLPANSQAIVDDDTEIKLTAATSIRLPGGKQAAIPGDTLVLLAGGTRLTLPDEAEVTLLKSRPRPVYFENFFENTYQPDPTLVRWPYPVKDIDFTSSGAYAPYNWELFFHVPLTVAMHLSKNQRFAEAQRWFHYIFDPTDDSDGPTPERFWKVRPFQYTNVKKAEEILVNLATGADEDLRRDTIKSIEAWKDAPFRPHIIARYRQQAYMYKTVMAYLDNLIAWGDSLFRQDTGEAIDEAMMLYVLAANILGPRPQPVPRKGSVRPETYGSLRRDLRQFGTVMREMEADLPFDLMPFPAEETSDNNQLATVRSLGKALYFCVPRNDKLLGYWDTVADRLFKIRNSLNLQGTFRQLALFEPPIDPALLARAAAAGLDIGAIVNGLHQPLPLVRFTFLVQKAAEIAQEVKSLGNNLLSAMEKEDGEAMAILRARHERAVMEMVEHVKYGQLQEAIKSKEGLYMSLALAVQRYTYYEQQLGGDLEKIRESVPALTDLTSDEKRDLFDMKFSAQEPSLSTREVAVDIAQDLGASGGRIISSHEAEDLEKSGLARDIQDVIKGLNLAAQGSSLIPDFGIKFHFWGLGGDTTIGGTKLSDMSKYAADVALAYADRLTYEAGRAAKIGSYARREQDWVLQANLAAGEITQIFKQLRGAQIREAIAERELENHRKQIKHAEEMEHFLNEEGAEKTGKQTNKAFYAWLKREVKGLYSQSFQFAFDVARKAERALQHELGNTQLSYIQFGYLAGKEGLLAGDKLYLDIKRMEMAYHELNQREYELTKHVSLLQVDPLALIQLRETGRCTVRLPESLFDMDGPGHYFRRMKTVALSLPCVTGPYASVNCRLTLLKSSIRTDPVLRDGFYAREDAEDARFDDYFGSLHSIVTSTAQNDSGLFETNLRDERYLPFENFGAISEWQLELPANPSKQEPAQFDYRSISDAVLHIRYTAREGGALLRSGAIDEQIEHAKAAGSVRLFSVRHEFSTAWAKFQNQTPAEGQKHELALELREEHYPFWSQDRLDGVVRVDLLARSSQGLELPEPPEIKVFDSAAADEPVGLLMKDEAFGGLLFGKVPSSRLPAPLGKIELYWDNPKTIADLWIAVTWSSE